jgi:hypothetical protein
MAKKVLKKESLVVKKEAPIVVKILSILTYIGAALTLLGGIMMLIGSAFIGTMLAGIAGVPTWLTGAGTAALIFLGIIFIGLSVLDYFIARGLWTGKNWARILVLIFVGLGALSSLISLKILSLIVYGLIIWYLGFNKEAVAYFK